MSALPSFSAPPADDPKAIADAINWIQNEDECPDVTGDARFAAAVDVAIKMIDGFGLKATVQERCQFWSDLAATPSLEPAKITEAIAAARAYLLIAKPSEHSKPLADVDQPGAHDAPSPAEPFVNETAASERETSPGDAGSAPGHPTSANDGNRAQRPLGEASEPSQKTDSEADLAERTDAAEAIDTTEAINMTAPLGIPFMITAAMKAALRDRGYTTAEIERIKPNVAHQILGAPDGVAASDTVVPFHRPDRPAVSKPAGTGKPNSKLEAALDLASRGLAVFPLNPGSKTPFLKKWPELATTDPERIRKCWTEDPSRNVAIQCAGLVVIDIDPRNGGDKSWEELAPTVELPKTSRAQTWSGGSHIIYALPKGVRLKSNKNVLGPGIDIKSGPGSYIVGAGSEINGRPYKWIDAAPVAMAPQWLIDRCKAARWERSASAGKRIVEEDEKAVELAQQYLDKHAPTAVLGEIDNTAFAVAARFYDFGVSSTTAEYLLAEWSETHADPPMDDSDIKRVAQSAGRNRQNAIGARHPSASGFEPVEIAERPTKADASGAEAKTTNPTTEKQPFTITARPFVLRDLALIKPRRWLYGDHYIRQFLSMTSAPGGLGKSSLTLVEAVAMAAGKNLLGVLPNRGKQFRTLYWNGEDPLDEIERRVGAICQRHEITANDLGDRLILLSGRDTPLCIARATRNGLEIVKPVVAELERFIRDNQIDVAIFDPLIALHEVPESDNTANKAVCRQLANVADKANCSIELVDHMRKGASGEQGERTADDTRGASSKIDAARCVRVLNRMAKDDAPKAGVENHRLYFRADDGNGKGNLTRPAEHATWYRLESVNLHNGDDENDADSVGVVMSWEWPDPSSSLSSDNIRAIQAKIATCKWQKDIRATAWAGYAVAQALGWEVDEDDKKGKERAKMVLQALIKDKFLRTEQGKNERRKDTDFIVVGKQVAQFEVAPSDLHTTFDTAPVA